MRVGVALGALLAGAGAAGVVLWHRGRLEQEAKIRRLEARVRDLGDRLDRMKASSYVADARVLSGARDPATGEGTWRLRFVEYGPGGEPIAPAREISVRGEEVYFEALLVEFEERFVEVGDGLRGKSLHLFRRVFGDRQKPTEGERLWAASGDEIPTIYRPRTLRQDDDALEFERGIWRRFWALADDPEAARRSGVRFAYGEAVSQRLQVGQVYRLTLRHAGGLRIERLVSPALLGEEGTGR